MGFFWRHNYWLYVQTKEFKFNLKKCHVLCSCCNALHCLNLLILIKDAHDDCHTELPNVLTGFQLDTEHTGG